MIRVLQVVNIMDRAGLETMLMNYYRNIDRNVIQFDFLTHREEKGAYDDEIEALGGKIYHAPRLYPQNYLKYFKYMNQFFDEHPEYQIIHSHIDSMSAFPLLMAKYNKIPVRIAHSHTSRLDLDAKLFIKYIAKLIVPHVATHYFACGEKAGKFLFGKRNYSIIHNAIELSKYSFFEEKRKEIRKRLMLDNKIVIGHVGRYCYIKNQLFLLEVVKEILKSNSNIAVLFIGKGPDEQKLRKKVLRLGLEKHVHFLIDRPDVEDLYQAMDLFVMPSLFEGLPVVGIEAQANGLSCLLSDNISKEILCTSSVEFFSMNSGAEMWAEKILTMDTKRNVDAKKQLQLEGYDIETESKKLQECYLNF